MKKTTIKKKEIKNKKVLIPNISFCLPLEELCDILNIEIKNNKVSIGIDVAQKRTGLCVLRTTDKEIHLDNLFLIDVSGVGKGNIHKNLANYFNQLVEYINNIKSNKEYTNIDKIVIIEDCWLGYSVWTTKLLARFETVAFMVSRMITSNIPDPIQPSSARKKVGFKKDTESKLKIKEQITGWLEDKLSITIEDDNLCDAFILSLCGLIDDTSN
jgi:Holliday junction resolvasome RuvABC endonuclease subunit